MSEGSDLTLGEIGRGVERVEQSVKELRDEMIGRHHKLANDLNVLLGPMSALNVRMNTAEKQIESLTDRVDKIVARSAYIAGLIAGIFGIVELVWRHL